MEIGCSEITSKQAKFQVDHLPGNRPRVFEVSGVSIHKNEIVVDGTALEFEDQVSRKGNGYRIVDFPAEGGFFMIDGILDSGGQIRSGQLIKIKQENVKLIDMQELIDSNEASRQVEDRFEDAKAVRGAIIVAMKRRHPITRDGLTATPVMSGDIPTIEDVDRKMRDVADIVEVVDSMSQPEVWEISTPPSLTIPTPTHVTCARTLEMAFEWVAKFAAFGAVPLPVLKGSEEQVAKASKIRDQFVRFVVANYEGNADGFLWDILARRARRTRLAADIKVDDTERFYLTDVSLEDIDRALDELLAKIKVVDDAKFYIDNDKLGREYKLMTALLNVHEGGYKGVAA